MDATWTPKFTKRYCRKKISNVYVIDKKISDKKESDKQKEKSDGGTLELSDSLTKNSTKNVE